MNFRKLHRLINESYDPDDYDGEELDDHIAALERTDTPFRQLDLGGYPHLLIPDRKVVDDDGTVHDRREYVDSMSESNLWHMVGEQMPEVNYWDLDKHESVLYHASPCENKRQILERGIEPRKETRGISNRSTGAAVFASTDNYGLDSYGDCRFEIDLSKMKADGYTPTITQEEPFEEINMKKRLANLLDVGDDYYPEDSLQSEGIWGHTRVIHGDVPARYISPVE